MVSDIACGVGPSAIIGVDWAMFAEPWCHGTGKFCLFIVLSLFGTGMDYMWCLSGAGESVPFHPDQEP